MNLFVLKLVCLLSQVSVDDLNKIENPMLYIMLDFKLQMKNAFQTQLFCLFIYFEL